MLSRDLQVMSSMRQTAVDKDRRQAIDLDGHASANVQRLESNTDRRSSNRLNVSSTDQAKQNLFPWKKHEFRFRKDWRTIEKSVNDTSNSSVTVARERMAAIKSTDLQGMLRRIVR